MMEISRTLGVEINFGEFDTPRYVEVKKWDKETSSNYVRDDQRLPGDSNEINCAYIFKG